MSWGGTCVASTDTCFRRANSSPLFTYSASSPSGPWSTTCRITRACRRVSAVRTKRSGGRAVRGPRPDYSLSAMMIDLYQRSNDERPARSDRLGGMRPRTSRSFAGPSEGRATAAADFLALNPSGAIPVLVDSDGPQGTPITVTQSGAIVLYCAEKSGRLTPKDRIQKKRGAPMVRPGSHGRRPRLVRAVPDVIGPEPKRTNLEFFRQRFLKHCANVDRRLQGRDFLADEFSIADVALYPIIAVRTALI